MKVLVLALVLSFVVLPFVFAEGITDLLDDLPNLKESALWDLESDVLLTATTADILTWETKDKVPKASLGAGLATDFDDFTYPIVEVCYKIGGLEDLGFTYPLSEFVKLEVKAFMGREFATPEKDWHYGLGLGIFDAKF